MRKKQKNKSGLTFIEVMIATLITMIVVGAVLAVFNSGDKVLSNDMKWIELQQKARGAIHGMGREMRQASATTITTASCTGTGAAKTCDDISFAITDDIVTTPVTYYLRYFVDTDDDGQLRLVRENPADDKSTGTVEETPCETLANTHADWQTTGRCIVILKPVESVDTCCVGGTPNGYCDECNDAESVQINIVAETQETLGQRTMPLSTKVRLRND